MLRRSIVIAAIAATLTGCGSAGLTNLVAADMQKRAGAAQDHKGPGEGLMIPGLMPGLDLGLTDDQQAQLKALMAQDKPVARPSHDAGKADAGKALSAALLADTVDDATLRAAIQAVTDEAAGFTPPNPGDKLKAVYDILTADQRALIVAKLQEKPAPKARPEGSPRPRPSAAARGEDKLALSDEQKAALDALRAAQKPAEPVADPEQGMLAFWQTGDTSSLAAPKPPAFPTEELVKAAEVLTLAQRKVVFGHGFGFGGGFPGGPGGFGPGGPGGPGGFGPGGEHGFAGKGGPGGPGGEQGFAGKGGFAGKQGGHGGPRGGKPAPEASPAS